MTDAKTPGQRLTLARIAAGYDDPVDFYRAFDIPQATYTPHETGGRGIRRDVAEKYARYLGNCTAAWILYGEGTGPAMDNRAVGSADRPAVEGATVDRRYQETAAFLLLYDRLATLTEENEKTASEEFGVVFRHFGYQGGPRGLAQLTFHLWQQIVAEDNALSLAERAIQKIEWTKTALDQLVDMFRQIQPAVPRPPKKPSGRK